MEQATVVVMGDGGGDGGGEVVEESWSRQSWSMAAMEAMAAMAARAARAAMAARWRGRRGAERRKGSVSPYLGDRVLPNNPGLVWLKSCTALGDVVTWMKTSDEAADWLDGRKSRGKHAVGWGRRRSADDVTSGEGGT
eukprot:6164433-Prymnesium_polylepis.1